MNLKYAVICFFALIGISCKRKISNTTTYNHDSRSDSSFMVFMNSLKRVKLYRLPFGHTGLDISHFPVDSAHNKEDSLQNIYQFYNMNEAVKWEKIGINVKGLNNVAIAKVSSYLKPKYLLYDNVDSVLIRPKKLSNSFYMHQFPSIGPYKLFYRVEDLTKTNSDGVIVNHLGDLLLCDTTKKTITVLNVYCEYNDKNNFTNYKWLYIDKNGNINLFKAANLEGEESGVSVTKTSTITIDGIGNVTYTKTIPRNYYGKLIR